MSARRLVDEWLDFIDELPGWRYSDTGGSYEVYPPRDPKNAHTLRPIPIAKNMSEAHRDIDAAKTSLRRAGLPLDAHGHPIRPKPKEPTTVTPIRPATQATPGTVQPAPETDLFARARSQIRAGCDSASQVIDALSALEGLLDQIENQTKTGGQKVAEQLEKIEQAKAALRGLLT